MGKSPANGSIRLSRKRVTRPADLAFDPIDAALRQLHEQVVSEDIPDDFLRLLDKLDDKTEQRSS